MRAVKVGIKKHGVRRISHCIERKALVAMTNVMTDDLKGAILETFQLFPDEKISKHTFIIGLGHTQTKISEVEDHC